MKIFVASDHAGFELKKRIIERLKRKGFEVIDKGPFEYVETDDYPDFISLVAREVSKDSSAKGIVMGGGGQGEAMVANRFKGVRAAVFYGEVLPKQAVEIERRESKDPLENIRLSRTHNNANILSIGARFVTETEAFRAIDVWLATHFSNEERHARRIKKIDLYPTV